MKNKKSRNKKLIILVSILLLTVGVSFAYFASQVLSSGNGTATKGTTASINGATVTITGNLEFNDTSIYPGHKNISSIKVTATGDNELIPYNLIWTGTNSLNTTLNYTIYKTSSNIDVTATCEKKMKIENGAQILKEECSISNIESLGTEISSGTISTSNTGTKVTLATDEFITATSDGMSVYYYVILEYPNLEASQNEDIGGTFTGKVNVEASNTEPDINILAAYIEQEDGSYQESTDIPQSGYTLNTSKSTCSNGATSSGSVPNITINNLSKSGTSCYLYFDITNTFTIQDVLATKTISTRTDFSTVLTTDTTGTIYSAEDDYGTSYYYAGAPTDNWVKFGGFYWRIIRINGDGTIRMIYNGLTNAMIETHIGRSTFNSSYDNNMYVGYMYTENQVHGRDTASTIKGVLDSWYDSNLANYADYIATGSGATFCNERYPSTNESSSNGSGGTGTTVTYYGHVRLRVNKAPTLKCVDGGDRFSINIGLITADEAAYAGSVFNVSNSNYYLTGSYNYWTMTASIYHSAYCANEFWIDTDGGIFDSRVNYVLAVRPVINLKSNTQFAEGGTGTAENPYVVLETD